MLPSNTWESRGGSKTSGTALCPPAPRGRGHGSPLSPDPLALAGLGRRKPWLNPKVGACKAAQSHQAGAAGVPWGWKSKRKGG